MLRTFTTHKYRKTVELSDKLWDFTPEQGNEAGIKRKLWVPGCWENYPGLENYRGTGIYETEFEAEGNVRIEFKGVSHFAKVFIDEEFITEHYGSYTAFEACKGGLSAGVHKLRVEVDNSYGEKYALDVPNDYYSYGGISRGVSLESVPDVYIQWIHVTPLEKVDNKWKVKVEVACTNMSETPQKCDVEITLAGKQMKFSDIRISAKKNLKCDLKKSDRVDDVSFENVWGMENAGTLICSEVIEISDVEEWCMENPVLYYVEAVLKKDGELMDDLVDRFGFRKIEVEGKKLLLNGRSIQIKGFCRHEDHPHYGCAIPASAMQHDLQLMKDIGANAVRTSHYPNDEIFLDLCDEMGIIVWEENHARGLSLEQMQNPYFEEQAEQVIREMMAQHYNHPGIIIWGILNECASEMEYGRECYKKQLELIKELDKSRPCSFASCKFKTDICLDLVDIVSYNIYPQWYHSTPVWEYLDDLYQWVQDEKGGKGKPFIISEIGAGAIYGFHSSAYDMWSEELQREILEKQLTAVTSYEDCTGVFIWQFCDVRVCKEWAMHRPKSRNNKGIVDEYRRPKLVYGKVKEIYRSLPDYRDL